MHLMILCELLIFLSVEISFNGMKLSGKEVSLRGLNELRSGAYQFEMNNVTFDHYDHLTFLSQIFGGNAQQNAWH